MVQSWIVAELVERGGGSGFGIRSGKDQGFDASLNESPHAHRARFERNVDGAADAVSAKNPRSLPQRDDLGVGGGVAIDDRAIVPPRNLRPANHKNRSDRNLPQGLGTARLAHGVLHPAKVVVDLGRSAAELRLDRGNFLGWGHFASRASVDGLAAGGRAGCSGRMATGAPGGAGVPFPAPIASGLPRFIVG